MKRLTIGGIAALAILSGAAGTANADSVLTQGERLIVDQYPTATCSTMDDLFDGVVADDYAYLEGVLQAMSEHYGITQDNAMDIVNIQVYEYCPRHWDNLVAVGESTRAASGRLLPA